MDAPLPELQHLPPLQLSLAQWLPEEQGLPSTFLSSTHVGLLVPPQVPLSVLPLGHQLRQGKHWPLLTRYPLLSQVLQSPAESHAVQPVVAPLELQQCPPLQLPLAQWLSEEQDCPSGFLSSTHVGLLDPPQLPLSFWPLGQLVRQR